MIWFYFHGLFMAELIVPENRVIRKDPRGLQRIREKFRDIFGRDITMADDALVQRYRVSGEGDLIMILR
jgi:hypothetical protein